MILLQNYDHYIQYTTCVIVNVISLSLSLATAMSVTILISYQFPITSFQFHFISLLNLNVNVNELKWILKHLGIVSRGHHTQSFISTKSRGLNRGPTVRAITCFQNVCIIEHVIYPPAGLHAVQMGQASTRIHKLLFENFDSVCSYGKIGVN